MKSSFFETSDEQKIPDSDDGFRYLILTTFAGRKFLHAGIARTDARAAWPRERWALATPVANYPTPRYASLTAGLESSSLPVPR